MPPEPSYVRVLLPLKLAWLPTYSSPEPLQHGTRVSVALGRRRYDGVVWESIAQPDLPASRIQPILSVQPELPEVSDAELRFWRFLSDYYLCTLGEVYKAAYPLLRLRSEHTAADKLERLRERLVRKEQDLQRRHTERVQQRLEAECAALRGQLEALSASCPPPPPAAPAGSLPTPRLLTGPARREAYLPAVQEALAQGRQVLVLSPEIAFCDKLEALLAPALGARLQLFHSGRTPVERRSVAESLRQGAPAVVLGTRSALFLPFRSLGLVLIDEEQDPAYKQTEPAPRYHARDAAIALAGIHGARVLLGAAVPSLETLYNVRLGKYSLDTPFAPAPSAAEIIDLGAERRKRGINGSFSRKLLAAIAQTDGPVVLLRGWEKPQELQEEIATLLPGRDVTVSTLSALKRQGAPGAALIGVLQADALVSRDDFRSDERAAQLVGTLCQFAPRVVIQTALPTRFDGSRSLDDLLAERDRFRFPPATRLVEVKRQGSGEILERHFLPRDRSLADRKAAIARSLGADCYADVDPLDADLGK